MHAKTTFVLYWRKIKGREKKEFTPSPSLSLPKCVCNSCVAMYCTRSYVWVVGLLCGPRLRVVSSALTSTREFCCVWRNFIAVCVPNVPAFIWVYDPRFELRPPTMKFPDTVRRDGSVFTVLVSPASRGFIFLFLQTQSQQFRPSWSRVFANCPGKNKGFGALNIPLCVLTCKFPARMWLICSFLVPVGRSCALTAALEPGMRSHLNRQCVLTTLLLRNWPR